MKQVEKIIIPELDDVIPLVNDGTTLENNYFRWFRIEKREDFELLDELFLEHTGVEPKTYPTLACLEFIYELFSGEAYCYFIEDCVTSTKDFWEKFNVNFEFDGKKASDVSWFYVKGIDDMAGQTFAKCTTIEKAQHAREILEEQGFASRIEIVKETLEEDTLLINSEKITL